MASLQDFFGGMPLTNDALQAMVNLLDRLQENQTRTVWRRQWDGSANQKDTKDGDDVVVVGFTRSVENKSIGAGAEDVEVTVNFPVSFTRPPALIATAIAAKPLMCSVSNLTNDSVIINMRSVGSIDNKIDVRGVNIIAIGPKTKSG